MLSVVIVDDHPAIRMAVRSVLQAGEKLSVVGEAENGPEAITMVRELRPALVILDLDLPRMNGLELIERLRNIDPALKLLVLSAQQESIFATRALQAGANGFMSKSEDMSAIVQASMSVLAGYSVFPSSALVSLSGAPGTSTATLIRSLSDRELTVMQHLARGQSNKEIADTLLISNKTVSSYKTRIFEKLGITTLVELLDIARANELIT